ncbi:MAG: hypothetical protein ACE5KP_03335 [Dehalococcoidales bacterium]
MPGRLKCTPGKTPVLADANINTTDHSFVSGAAVSIHVARTNDTMNLSKGVIRDY